MSPQTFAALSLVATAMPLPSAAVGDDLDLSSQEKWIGAAAASSVFVVGFILYGGAFKLMPRITFDVIEQQRDFDRIKDTVRNIWVNAGLIAALLLTITISMWLDQEILGSEDEWPAVVTAYGTFSGIATVMCAQVTLESTIHLTYTEALDSIGVFRYIIAYNGCIGGPIMSIAMAVLYFIGACEMWALLKYGAPCAICCGIFALVFSIILGRNFWAASIFSPDIQDEVGSAGWKWVESDDDLYKKLSRQRAIPEKLRSMLRQRYAQATADKVGTDRQAQVPTGHL